VGDEIAISLKNVSKCFKRYERPIDRLKNLPFFWGDLEARISVLAGQRISGGEIFLIKRVALVKIS
jgi:hypothetical protein